MTDQAQPAAAPMEVVRVEIAKLELKPGDVLVVRCTDIDDLDEIEQAVQEIRDVLKQVGVKNAILLSKDMELQVVKHLEPPS